jgi:uncharacterized 2Fe-2S/4Fe-4S cluster protein (DUF4445 family)
MINISNKKQFEIKFLPSNKSAKFESGYNLRQAIIDCGIDLESSCGGVGTCGRCKVQVLSGNILSKSTKFIDSKQKDEGFVLACKSNIYSDTVVFIPDKKQKKAKIEDDKFYVINGKAYSSIDKKELAEVEIDPWIIKEKIEVQKPTFQYTTTDLFRLKKAVEEKFSLENVLVPLHVIRKIPFVLRKNNWEIDILFNKRTYELLDIRDKDSITDCYGIALDIGTTTLALYLVDISTGKIIEYESDYNPQIRFGEDIINRIVYSTKKDGLKKLHTAIIGHIELLISRILDKTQILPEDISVMFVSANSTMMHIFYGVSPKFLREEPYITTVNEFPASLARDIEINIIKDAMVYSMIGVASYLGGDITSGVIATNISKRGDLSLLIDMGTNGEIVIGNKDWMIGCSCSAGPAFEGGGVKCGMRAAQGAIEKIKIEPKTYKCFFEVIGGSKPSGICGSGLLDLLGEMYLRSVIDRKGKFNKEINNPFLKNIDNEYRYVIAQSKDSTSIQDIYITEIDINNLIRAKAAIYSGIKTLIEEVGLKISDIDLIFIAGGLGKNINIHNAINIGMLPDIEINKYHFMGNTSLMGAYLCLLSQNKHKYMKELSGKITYLELSGNVKFMDRYVAGLFLPYTDFKEFPSLEKLINRDVKIKP